MHIRDALAQAAVMEDDVCLVIGLKALSGGRRLRTQVYRSIGTEEFIPVDLNIWLSNDWPASVCNCLDLADDVMSAYMMQRFGLQGVLISS